MVPPRPDLTANDTEGSCGGTIGDDPDRGCFARSNLELWRFGDLVICFYTLSLHINTHISSIASCHLTRSRVDLRLSAVHREGMVFPKLMLPHTEDELLTMDFVELELLVHTSSPNMECISP